MKILFFAYPHYADFEIAHTLFFLKKAGKADVTTVTVDGKSVESLGGLVVAPQLALAEVNPSEYDLVLISGGDGVEEVMDEPLVHDLLQKAHANQVPIAAICASAVLLAKAGLLKGVKFTCLPHTHEHFREAFADAGYTGAKVHAGEAFITAKGTAFAEFTVAVGEKLGMWQSREAAERSLRFCKGEV
ncbi:MAG TPA: DJ-1/PfpI family protein [Bacillales bacterium]|nr:DJ-1/PfpI family protein [Bacillales bacterium]